MAIPAQQAALVAAIKGNFNVRPIELDPFRAGNPYGKSAILDIKDLSAYASLEVMVDLPIERLGRVTFERNNTEIIGIDASYFHIRDSFKKLPVQTKALTVLHIHVW